MRRNVFLSILILLCSYFSRGYIPSRFVIAKKNCILQQHLQNNCVDAISDPIEKASIRTAFFVGVAASLGFTHDIYFVLFISCAFSLIATSNKVFKNALTILVEILDLFPKLLWLTLSKKVDVLKVVSKVFQRESIVQENSVTRKGVIQVKKKDLFILEGNSRAAKDFIRIRGPHELKKEILSPKVAKDHPPISEPSLRSDSRVNVGKIPNRIPAGEHVLDPRWEGSSVGIEESSQVEVKIFNEAKKQRRLSSSRLLNNVTSNLDLWRNWGSDIKWDKVKILGSSIYEVIRVVNVTYWLSNIETISLRKCSTLLPPADTVTSCYCQKLAWTSKW